MIRRFLKKAVSKALNESDCKTVESLLEEMDLAFHPLKLWEISRYYFLKTRSALFQNNFRQASAYVELALISAADLGEPVLLGLCHLAKVHVMLELREHRETAKHLSYAFDIALKTKNNLLIFYVLLAEVLFALDQEEEASALTYLRKGLSIGKKHGYLNMFIDQASVTVKLCAMALDAGIEVEYAQKIIRKHSLLPSNSLVHIKNWPWDLRIFTLGRSPCVRIDVASNEN